MKRRIILITTVLIALAVYLGWRFDGEQQICKNCHTPLGQAAGTLGARFSR